MEKYLKRSRISAGGGEVHSALDLKGQRIRIFVAEHQNANRIGRKILRAGLLGAQHT